MKTHQYTSRKRALLLVFTGLVLLVTAGCRSAAIRVPGETLVSDPEEAWADYECDQKKLPFAAIEENEINPTGVAAGEKFGHRFIYVLCSKHPGETVDGILHRRIMFNGRMVADDMVKNFKLRPGVWRVDAIIKVPVEAPVGIYSVEFDFLGGGLKFLREASLEVTEP